MKRITISFFGCLVAIAIGSSAPSALAGNKVLSLDGDGDYVEAPHIDFTGIFTVEVQILIGEFLHGDNGILGQESGPHVQNMALHLIIRNRKPYLGFLGNDVASQTVLEANKWYHIVFQYTGSEQRIYINGQLDAYRETTPYENTEGVTKIGYSRGFFRGLMDEVRVWDVARTQEEIQDHMNQPLGNPESEPNLVGYWNFDSGMADDLSRHGNDGQLKGDAYIADVICVSPTGDDTNGDGTIENPYKTIQRGIYRVGPGDIVQASPGIYEENIILISNLTVLGSCAENTIITAAGGNIVTANNVYNVSLSGFTIDGQGSADNGVMCSGTTSEMQISNNIIIGATTGIICSDNAKVTIKNNTICHNFSYGILCENSTQVFVKENTIESNYNGVCGKSSAILTIDNNFILTNGEHAIICFNTVHADIYNNVIAKNGNGIQCQDSSVPRITQNTIRDNTYLGIAIYCNGNPLVSENLIYGYGEDGIRCGGSCNAMITRNTVARGNSITIFNSAKPTIGGDLTSSNNIIEIRNNTSNTINATFNYWGTTDETEIAAMIQNTGDGSVKFKPFVTEYNKIVADTSGDGTVSAYDAALILQFVVGLIDTFPISITQSPDQTTPRNYTVSLPSLAAHVGKRIQAPVAINDANGLIAGGIILKYDPTVLKAVDVLPTTTLNGSYWKANTKLDGEIRFAFMFTSASGDASYTTKTLFMVEFDVLPHTTGKVSPLILDNVQFPENQSISKINGSVIVLPETSMLLQNYPNPFNPETWIPYQLATDSPVMISIYNAKGQLIRALNLGNQNAGIYMTKDKAAYWDGKDETGEKVASGVYFYALQVEHQRNSDGYGTGKFISTRKMVIAK